MIILTYGQQKLASALFNAEPLGNPGSWWLALVDANGNEFTAPSYARVEAKCDSVTWLDGIPVRNNVALTWPKPLELWGVPAFVRFYDAQTVGQDWFQLPLAGDTNVINALSPSPVLDVNTITLRFDT